MAYGSMVKTAEGVRKRLQKRGIECALINMRFAKPLDTQMLKRAAGRHKLVVTMEENVKAGGMGEAVRSYLEEIGAGVMVMNVAFADAFVPHGSVQILKQTLGLDEEGIAASVEEMYRNKKDEEGI